MQRKKMKLAVRNDILEQQRDCNVSEHANWNDSIKQKDAIKENVTCQQKMPLVGNPEPDRGRNISDEIEVRDGDPGNDTQRLSGEIGHAKASCQRAASR